MQLEPQQDSIEASALRYNKYATRYIQTCIIRTDPCPAFPPPAVTVTDRKGHESSVATTMWEAAQVILPPIGGWIVSEQLD